MEELEGGGGGVWSQNLREVVMQCMRAAMKKADNGHYGRGQRVSEGDKLPVMAARRSIVNRSWHCGINILVLYEAKRAKAMKMVLPVLLPQELSCHEENEQTNMSCVSFNHDKL